MVGAGGGADFIGFSDEFDGEIVASGGVRINAWEPGTNNLERAVRWTVKASGETVGYLITLYQPFGGRYVATLDLEANDRLEAGANKAEDGVLTLSAKDIADNLAGFNIEARGPNSVDGVPNRRAINARAGALTNLLLRQDGISDWVFNPGAWHAVGAAGEPAYNGNWANYSASYSSGFRKENFDVVRLRGLVKATGAIVSGTPIFTLPVGYRPTFTAEAIALITRAGTFLPAEMWVNPAGAVNVIWNGANLAANDYATMDFTFSTT